jgi:hypothetical protein
VPGARFLRSLPAIARTRALTRSLAVLDAILSPDWERRYYSFDPAWGESGEAMASMRNGSGDEWFCWFGPPGAAIVGCDHESPMSPWAREPKAVWPGLADGLPEAFAEPVLREPAFSPGDMTFLLWREHGDREWRSGRVVPPEGSDPDGAEWLLALLASDDPSAYAGFAAEYYETAVALEPVAAVWRSEPLTAEIVAALNPRVTLAAVAPDVVAAGYPVASPA